MQRSEAMMNTPLVVTVDGTAGCGKSTLARKFAFRWNALYVNSGLLYRSIAYRYIQERGLVGGFGKRGDNELHESLGEVDGQILSEILAMIEWDLCRTDEGGSILLIDCRPPIAELLSEEVAGVASELAVIRMVRERCTTFQQEEAVRYPRVVVEGRDAGTVVFPGALAKWYVDAPLGVRAQRRVQQLRRVSPGQPVSLAAIESHISRRDTRDMTRTIAPQRPAEDAIVVDTFAEKQGDILRTMEQVVRDRGGW